MCKIMMMAGVNNDNRELAWKFVHKMGDLMSRANTDGLGYAAVSADGNLFAERWLKNSDAFIKRNTMTQEERDIIEMYGGALELNDNSDYNKVGSVQEDSMVAITLHTRMATTPKCMGNVHPFITGDTSLIHNGVIRNHDKIGLKQSTCDSEAILNLYTQHKVTNNIEHIQKVAKRLQGWYACGVLTKTPESQWVMDVFKDTTTRLSAVLTDRLGLVFTTDADDATVACFNLGITIKKVFKFKPGYLCRIDAISGELEEWVEFDCKDDMWSNYNKGEYRTTASDNKGSHTQSALQVVKQLEEEGWKMGENGAYYRGSAR